MQIPYLRDLISVASVSLDPPCINYTYILLLKNSPTLLSQCHPALDYTPPCLLTIAQ